MRLFNSSKVKTFLLKTLLATGVFSLRNLYSDGSEIIYLSWMDDPATTMVVQWIEPRSQVNNFLYFKRQLGEEEWRSVPSQILSIHGTEMVLKRVVLKNLDSGSEYKFSIRADKEKTYSFKTMPMLISQPIKFVVGGDVYYHYELFRKMNSAVASLSPDFVVLGGDIAYSIRRGALFKEPNWEWQRWETFLKGWHEQMIDEKGRLIPLVAVIGNHDTKGSYSTLLSGHEKSNLFYTLFPFKEAFGTYRTLLFGDYLALYLLDTGHTHPIDGEQAAWLEKKLMSTRPIPYKMAVYHVPAYVSHGNIKGEKSRLIRRAWCPLFEQYGVQAAFEHHSHTYMRSKKMKEGKVAEDGVTYLGGGSWGVAPRQPLTSNEVDYVEKSAKINAVYLVTMEQTACKISAIDNQGNLFDEVPLIYPGSIDDELFENAGAAFDK